MTGCAEGLLVVSVVTAARSQIDDVIDNVACHIQAVLEAAAAKWLGGEHLTTIALTSSAALSLVLMLLGPLPRLRLTPTRWTETGRLRGHQRGNKVTTRSPWTCSITRHLPTSSIT